MRSIVAYLRFLYFTAFSVYIIFNMVYYNPFPFHILMH